MKNILLCICSCLMITANAQTVTLVSDIVTGKGSSFPYNIILEKNFLFFTADDGVHGNELWRTDVNTNTTIMLLDINNGAAASNPSNKIVFNNQLYFSATVGASGVELYKVNLDGTNLTRLTNSPAANAIFNNSPFFIYLNRLYFSFDDGSHGFELWSTDGTTQGTKLVKDLMPGMQSTSPSDFFMYAGKLFFKGLAPIDTQGLYVTDGTTAGTDSFYNCGEEGCAYFTPFNNRFYFISDDQQFSQPNNEVYVSDGTKPGTHVLKDINPNGTGAFGYLRSSGNHLFFAGDDGVHGDEIWWSDGTAQGTAMLKDIRPGAQGSSVVAIIPFKGGAVFEAYPSTGVFGAYKSDASGNITFLDSIILNPGDNLTETAQYGNILLVNAYTGNAGYELCGTTGTPRQTGLVADIYKGLFPGDPRNFILKGDTLFFAASDEVYGNELFRFIIKRASLSSNEINSVAQQNAGLLQQNVPNPSTAKTTIQYSLPEVYKHAGIVITSFAGKTIKNIQLSKQSSSIDINTFRLLPGTYYYSLVIDGSVIATKQMLVQ